MSGRGRLSATASFFLVILLTCNCTLSQQDWLVPILSTLRGQAVLLFYLSIIVRPATESVLHALSILTVANNIQRVSRSGGLRIGRWHHSNSESSYKARTLSEMTLWMSLGLRRGPNRGATRTINTPTETSSGTIQAISTIIPWLLQLLQFHPLRRRHQRLRLYMDHVPPSLQHHRYILQASRLYSND